MFSLTKGGGGHTLAYYSKQESRLHHSRRQQISFTQELSQEMEEQKRSQQISQRRRAINWREPVEGNRKGEGGGKGPLGLKSWSVK